ncbi:MAG: IS607 family transposase [Thermoflexus hugenholtzii]|uniref:IS607 family transposase n=1 Tax=Thermoflexus hugenholtzii TaxID=1495650 RepID=UPI001C771122|nr:IS607 family transposase [Thermoflexus hugenholtzii]QWK12196.1 MAG: IS607 family transposase [Thermoflexus hugenholtzii]
MKLSDWARQQGISDITAWRWFRAGKLPVPARPLPAGTIWVEAPHPEGITVLYARVSSADQKEDLERQVQRLQAFAQEQGWTEVKAATEIGFGLNGKRKKLLRILRDPQVVRIVVEHRDRLARFGFDLLEAAMAASGRHVVVIEEGEVTDDLAQDVLEILTSACGRLDGRRSARRRAQPAWEATGCK